MKKSLIKVDRWFLDQLTDYVKRWIAKREYKKHKFDFLIQLEWMDVILCLVLGTILPVLWYVIAHKYWAATLHLCVWGAFVGMRIMGILTTQKLKIFHDYFFAMRKNPQIYEIEKEATEKIFLKSRRDRIFWSISTFTIAVTIGSLLIMLDQAMGQIGASTLMAFFIVIDNVLTTIQRYVIYVFDFDEPEQKKRVKESITELVLREWQRIVGALNPQPNYG